MRKFMVEGDEFVCELVERSPRERGYGWAPVKWRKIISGTTFNSATSIELATYMHDEIDGAVRHEQLFQTPTGQFILVGDGESHSPWSKQLPDCNSFVLGHAFVPLTIVESKRWLEVRELDQEFEEIFGGEVAEATQILLKLPPALVNRAVKSAKGQMLTMQAWIQNAVEEHARRCLEK